MQVNCAGGQKIGLSVDNETVSVFSLVYEANVCVCVRERQRVCFCAGMCVSVCLLACRLTLAALNIPLA